MRFFLLNSLPLIAILISCTDSFDEDNPFLPLRRFHRSTKEDHAVSLGNETIDIKAKYMNASSEIVDKELKLAEQELAALIETIRTEKEDLEKKREEAKTPNKLYEEKKVEWGKLNAEAYKETNAAKKAREELEEAEELAEEPGEKLKTAKEDLDDLNEELEQANKDLEKFKEAPTRLPLAKQERDQMKTDDTCKKLKDSLNGSSGLRRLMNNASTAAEKAKELAHDQDEVVKACGAACTAEAIDLQADLSKQSNDAQTKFERAKGEYEKTKNESDACPDKVKALEKEIEDLEKNEPKNAQNILNKQAEIDDLTNKKIPDATRIFNEVKQKYDPFLIALGEKQTALENAEKLDQQNPKATEKQAARTAKLNLIPIEKEKDRHNNDIQSKIDKLKELEARKARLEERVGALKQVYQEALAKQRSDPAKSSALATVLAIVGGLLLLAAVAGILGYVFVIRPRRRRPEEKPQPSTTKVPSEPPAVVVQTPADPVVGTSGTPSTADTPVAVQPTTKSNNESADGVDKNPYIPGEAAELKTYKNIQAVPEQYKEAIKIMEQEKATIIHEYRKGGFVFETEDTAKTGEAIALPNRDRRKTTVHDARLFKCAVLDYDKGLIPMTLSDGTKTITCLDVKTKNPKAEEEPFFAPHENVNMLMVEYDRKQTKQMIEERKKSIDNVHKITAKHNRIAKKDKEAQKKKLKRKQRRDEKKREKAGRDQSGNMCMQEYDNETYHGVHDVSHLETTLEASGYESEDDSPLSISSRAASGKEDDSEKSTSRKSHDSEKEADDKETVRKIVEKVKEEKGDPEKFYELEYEGKKCRAVFMDNGTAPDMRRITHDKDNNPRQGLSKKRLKEITDACLNSFKPGNENKVYIEKEERYELLNARMKGFHEEPRLIERGARDRHYIGDLHGNVDCLNAVFRAHGEIGSAQWKKTHFIFLGDYVDRGSNSDALINALFALKELYPENIDLLRGNHESYDTNVCYGFYDEMIMRCGKDGRDLHIYYNMVFSCMPIAHLCGGILAMHGCIPGVGFNDVKTELNELDKFIWFTQNTPSYDFMWADPTLLETLVQMEKKGVGRGSLITAKRFDEFLIANVKDVKMIVRAHQNMRNGFELIHGKRVVSIFSATSYEPDKFGNHGAVMRVTVDNVVSFLKLVPVEFPTTGINADFVMAAKQRAIFDHNSRNFSTMIKGAHEEEGTKPNENEASVTIGPEEAK